MNTRQIVTTVAITAAVLIGIHVGMATYFASPADEPVLAITRGK